MIYVSNSDILIIINFNALVLTQDASSDLNWIWNHDMLIRSSSNTFLMNVIITDTTIYQSTVQSQRFPHQHCSISPVPQILPEIKHAHLESLSEQLFSTYPRIIHISTKKTLRSLWDND